MSTSINKRKICVHFQSFKSKPFCKLLVEKKLTILNYVTVV